MKGMASATACVGLWLGFLSLSAAERPHFDSQVRDGAITVDGKYNDWYGHLQPFGKEPIAIQFLNDGEFLYVRLTASDAATRMQIVRQGMTIWFDPGGGSRKKLGIKYPVVEGGGPGWLGGGPRRRGEGVADEEIAPADRVDILGPGKNDARSQERRAQPDAGSPAGHRRRDPRGAGDAAVRVEGAAGTDRRSSVRDRSGARGDDRCRPGDGEGAAARAWRGTGRRFRGRRRIRWRWTRTRRRDGRTGWWRGPRRRGSAWLPTTEAPERLGDRDYCAGSIARTVRSAASRSSVSSGIQQTIES